MEVVQTIHNKKYNIKVKDSAIERKRTSTVKENFSELVLDLFNECNTFKDIGEKYGVTRESIRLYYSQYLAGTLPCKTGRDRISECTIREPVRIASHRSVIVWKKLKSLGFDVKRWNNHAWTKLLVNDNLINLRFCNTIQTTSPGNSYHHTSIRINSLERNSIYIFVVSTGDYFIIPSEILFDRFEGKKDGYLFIPVIQKEIYNNHGAKIDWNQFKNNFDTLGERLEKDT